MAKFEFETAEQVMDAARSMKQREYWETVSSLAEEAIESSKDESEQDEHAWESVDGCSYVIYTRENLEVLLFTSNDDAWQEYGELDPSKALMQMAFGAMMADVREKMQELRDSAEAEGEAE